MRTFLLRLLAAFVSLILAAHTFADDQPASISGPAVAWKFNTGQEVVSAPILADGVLYCGSKSYGFFAIDAATGTLIWKLDAKFPVSSKAAIAGDLVDCADIQRVGHCNL